MINEINVKDLLKFNLEGDLLQLKEGEKVTINVVKSLTDGFYLINLKGKSFTALFQSPPQFGKLIVEVVKTDPNIELKVIKDEVDLVDKGGEKLQLKKDIVEFNPKEMAKIFSKSGLLLDMKSISPEKLKKIIRDSGIFFENKLANSESIDNDVKFLAIKNGDQVVENNINKLQIILILAELSGYLPIETLDEDIDDLELFIHKKGISAVTIKGKFSVLGETLIHVRENAGIIDCVVQTVTDISEELKNGIFSEGIMVKWRKLDLKDYSELDIKRISMEKLGSFEMVV